MDQTIDQITSTNSTFTLQILINTIIATYFADNFCILQLGDKLENLISLQNFPTVNYLVKSERLTSISLNETLNINEYQRCTGFLITGENVSTILTSLEDHLRFNRQERYNNRRYVIVHPEGDLSKFEKLQFIADLLIIQRATDNFRFITHNYVGKDENNYKVIGTWNGSFDVPNDLYPDKLNDQQGRIIKVAAMNNLPFAFTETKRGFELGFVIEYCKKYNATCAIEKETGGWGFIFENFTGYAIQGKVVSDQIDIATGSIYISPYRLQFTDFSNPTIDVEVTCLVPKPIEFLGWFNFIKVFDVSFWLFIGIVYVSSSTCKYIITRFTNESAESNFQNQLMFTFALFVGQNCSDDKYFKNNSFRFAHANIQLFCIIFATVYTSTLLGIMVIPVYYGDIRTVHELAESGLHWGELDDAWKIHLANDRRQDYKTVYESFRKSTFNELREHSIQDYFGFAVERLPRSIGMGAFIKDDIIDRYKIMSDSLYKPRSALLMRKHSILIPSINKLIQRAHEAGLFSHWELLTTIHHLNMNIQNALIYPQKQQVRVNLTVAHIKGPLAFWVLGMSIAIVSFLLEIIIFERHKRNVIVV